MSEQVKSSIKKLFQEMNREVDRIINVSFTAKQATNNILAYVPERVAAATEGYMIDLYKALSQATLQEPVFQKAKNANKFYALQLRQKITAAYRFDVKDLRNYIRGQDFNTVQSPVAAVGAGVGAACVSGALLGLLSAKAAIPVVGVIALAVAAGLAAAAAVANIPKIGKNKYREAVKQFMTDLEKELLVWIDGVVKFYNSQVEELKASL